jgi:hypothetical protein
MRHRSRSLIASALIAAVVAVTGSPALGAATGARITAHFAGSGILRGAGAAVETSYVVTCSRATDVILGFDIRQHTRFGNGDSQGGVHLSCHRGVNRFPIAVGVEGYHPGPATVSVFLECNDGDTCGPATRRTMRLTTKGNRDVASAASTQVSQLSAVLYPTARIRADGVHLVLGITCPADVDSDYLAAVTLSQWSGLHYAGNPTLTPPMNCDGHRHDVAMTMYSEIGVFQPGLAFMWFSGQDCRVFSPITGCASVDVYRQVTLTRS